MNILFYTFIMLTFDSIYQAEKTLRRSHATISEIESSHSKLMTNILAFNEDPCAQPPQTISTI